MHEVRGDLGELQEELEKAVKRFDDCEREESQARSRTTSARNDVNQLQKQIDSVLAAMRKAAPRDTDWKREKGLPVG